MLFIVLGTMKHEIIEELFKLCMPVHHPSKQDANIGLNSIYDQGVISLLYVKEGEKAKMVEEVVNRVMQDHIEDLYCAHVMDTEIKIKLLAVVNPTLAFIRRYFVDVPAGRKAGSAVTSGAASDTRLVGIADSEEMIWSPILGLKGQLDITAFAQMKIPDPDGCDNLDSSRCVTSSSHSDLVFKCPIEIKTGAWKPASAVSHRAQVRSFSPIYFDVCLYFQVYLLGIVDNILHIDGDAARRI